ncbi:MAG: hypothetical protein ACLQFT_17985 [Steroidobacteraceae bacterium]
MVEEQAHIALELTHGLGDAAQGFRLDEADGDAAQARDIFRAMPRAAAAAILVVVPVDDVLAAVVDDPVAATDLERRCAVACAVRRLILELPANPTVTFGSKNEATLIGAQHRFACFGSYCDAP